MVYLVKVYFSFCRVKRLGVLLFCFVFLLGFLGGLLLIIYFYRWREVLGKSVVFKNIIMWLGFSMLIVGYFL